MHVSLTDGLWEMWEAPLQHFSSQEVNTPFNGNIALDSFFNKWQGTMQTIHQTTFCSFFFWYRRDVPKVESEHYISCVLHITHTQWHQTSALSQSTITRPTRLSASKPNEVSVSLREGKSILEAFRGAGMGVSSLLLWSIALLGFTRCSFHYHPTGKCLCHLSCVPPIFLSACHLGYAASLMYKKIPKAFFIF